MVSVLLPLIKHSGLFKSFPEKKKKKELPWAHDSSERKKEILKQRKSILIMCPEVPHVSFHIILVISI